jgi:ribose 5-phosphate isomerase B
MQGINMKIAIGSDHRGYNLKRSISEYLNHSGHDIEDFGTNSEESADYPDYAGKVAKAVTEKGFDYGILICGTGMGMCIAANKIRGVRGIVARNNFDAQRSRQHNDANVLCLGADITENDDAYSIIDTFINTPYDGGRHQRRLDKITDLEKQV